MAQTKLETHVLPRLIEIAAWCRDGMIDKDIAKNLGVAYSTFREYVKTESALSAALKKNKEVVDIQVENALLKRALGYSYTETTKEAVCNPETGKKELRITKKVEKEVPPDTTAGIFWMKNRRPDMWRDRKETELVGKVEVGEDTMESMLKAAGYEKK